MLRPDKLVEVGGCVRDVGDDIGFNEESESPSCEKVAEVSSKFLRVFWWNPRLNAIQDEIDSETCSNSEEESDQETRAAFFSCKYAINSCIIQPYWC